MMGLCFSYAGLAQSVQVVRSFGNQMTLWSQGHNFYIEEIDKLCNTDNNKGIVTRVSDRIVQSLAQKNLPQQSPNGSYTIESYVNWMQKEIDKGISISYYEIEDVPMSMIEKKYSKDGMHYVSCKIKITGTINYEVSDLFYVLNGKIVKIDNYDVIIDKKTGKRKVKISFDDLALDEVQAIGLNYNYSKSFPIGASISYSWSMFMYSLDFGINRDNDIISSQKVDITDIMNYQVTKGEYDPKFYISVTPSLYLKYVSIGCGIGTLVMNGTKVTESYNANDSYITSLRISLTSKYYKFMLRPNLTGYIPCSDTWSISVSVGYDYVFGYKKMTGWNFGVGLQYTLDL